MPGPTGGRACCWLGLRTGYLPFYATIVTDRAVRYLEVDASRVYRALLERALPYLGGESDVTPLSMRELLEPELLALAARRSWHEHGAEIHLADLAFGDPGYDGARFAAEYRRMRLTGTETFRVYTESQVGA